MQVADYIFQTLADWGVKNVFFVSSGGVTFLDNDLGKEKRIESVRSMHEQEAASLVSEILAQSGPIFCEVMTEQYEVPGAKSASKQMPDETILSQPLKNLAPLLPE